MEEGKVKVLYIVGHERSGSTLLHNVLGQLDGFFAAGELRRIWDRGLMENRLCRCGVPVKECEVWGRILDEAFGSAKLIDAHEVTRLRNRIRNRHFPLALLPGNERVLRSRLGSLPQYLGTLYRTIRFTTNSRVIVDSSKSPTYGYVLGTLPEIELYVVHLVRDPRSVQYSLLKRKVQGRRYLEHNSVKGALAWDVLNLAT
jgi:sulfotransferase family protein